MDRVWAVFDLTQDDAPVQGGSIRWSLQWVEGCLKPGRMRCSARLPKADTSVVCVKGSHGPIGNMDHIDKIKEAAD